MFLKLVAVEIAFLSIRLSLEGHSVSLVLYSCWALDMIVAPALIGYVIARLAKGRETTACLCLVVILALLQFGILTYFHGNWRLFGWQLISGDAIPAFFLLGAAVLARQRALTRQLKPAG